MRRWIPIVISAVVVAGVAAYFGIVYEPAIEPLAQPPRFDPALIAHGSELAAIGDCASCHTTAGGSALAGGVAVPTPFGTIYSSNISPDRDTGIGVWTEAAFVRAMQEGVDRGGRHLYPAFPFDHFTHVTVDDDKALYAYLMTRDPVKAAQRANQVTFPFNIRGIVAFWDLLFLKKGPIPGDSGQSAEWNRGRYLVEGLGHCGSCHTPRNSLGAEKVAQQYAGGPIVDGWFVYPINARNPAPTKWSADELAAYLHTGYSADHGASRGPMAQVTARMDGASDSDVHAMAVYVASLMGNGPSSPPPERSPPVVLTSGDSLAPPKVPASGDRGSVIYATACSACHDSGRPAPFGGIDFHNSTAVNADNPQNIINMVLYGLPAAEGRTGATMPGFAGTLSQDDMVALLGYLRSTFGNGKAPWPNTATQVADTMSRKTVVKLYGQDGVQRTGPIVTGRGTTP